MALIICPECNNEISDQAKTCPSCGFPLDKAPKHDQDEFDLYGKQEEFFTQQPTVREGETSYGLIGFILAIVALMLPVPWIDVVIGVVALVLSIRARTTQQDRNPGLAIAGIVISIIAIIGGVTLWTGF